MALWVVYSLALPPMNLVSCSLAYLRVRASTLPPEARTQLHAADFRTCLVCMGHVLLMTQRAQRHSLQATLACGQCSVLNAFRAWQREYI